MDRTDRNEIVDIVKTEIKKFYDDSLDKEMKKVLKNSNSQSRKEMVNTIKNGLEAAFKVFWIKRDFWTSDIK